MYKATTSRRFLAASLIAGTGIVSASIAPASAAVAHLHGAATTGHSRSHASSIPQRCKSQAKAKGIVKYSDWQFPAGLNQYQTTASVAYRTIYTMIEYLDNYLPNGKLYPELLAKLPTVKNGGISQDGKTYTLFLKKGLRWSNGTEITMNDVKFGLALGLNAASGPACAGSCDVISRIDVKNKYEGIFHLKNPYAPFLSLGLPPVEPVKWSSPHGSWKTGDVEAAVKLIWGDANFNFEDDTYPTDGPYQVQDFVVHNRITLKPMKYYDVMSCGARVAKLIFAFYADKPGMIAAAASHDTDTTTNYTPADVKTLQGHKQFKTVVLPSLNVEHLVMNADPTYKGKPNPLNKVQVRQALALALDKVTMIQSALGVSAAVAKSLVAYSPLVVTKALVQPFADKNLKGQWDPLANGGKGAFVTPGTTKAIADAKKLLQRAGYGSGADIDGVTTSGNPVRAAQFSVMEGAWQKIGVTFHPSFIPAGTMFSSFADGSPMYTGNFQIAMYTDGLAIDPDYLRTSFDSHFIDREKATHSDVNSQFMGVHDKALDRDMEQGARTTSKALRQKYYFDWQVRNNKLVYWLPLYYRTEISTDDGRIGNYNDNPITYQQWNTWEWFDKGKS